MDDMQKVAGRQNKRTAQRRSKVVNPLQRAKILGLMSREELHAQMAGGVEAMVWGRVIPTCILINGRQKTFGALREAFGAELTERVERACCQGLGLDADDLADDNVADAAEIRAALGWDA
ncbi:hypothetical protein GWI72_14250 [Microvirga tunisiensis]|uniref:Uncharacterized protein n=1 Tax=Pannonibacter tanglangensis TaxID=2750084 RepID=A0A7X5F6I8_9HYPH|nr:hypothetical protein [Pannonibacter sp. XCT-53]NBN79434.1 hypothetical protein [Pannonibacter sp. XCT-53]